MIVTLSADGLADLTIGDGSNSLCFTSHNLGAPTARDEYASAPDMNGDIDNTNLEGGSVLTFGVQSKPFVWSELQALKAFTRSSLRPTVTIDEEDGSPVRQVTGRLVPFPSPTEIDGLIRRYRHVVVQIVNASGVLESAEEATFEAPGSADITDGLDWPIVWPIDWGSAPATTGLIEVTNLGDREAAPVLQLHGEWSGLTYAMNLTTGKSLVFDNLLVADGDYLEIDVRARTIRLNGDPAQSRYDKLVFAGSEWWTLEPGVNVLRFLPASYVTPARMSGRFRHAYS